MSVHLKRILNRLKVRNDDKIKGNFLVINVLGKYIAPWDGMASADAGKTSSGLVFFCTAVI